jgi:hypothetical protein
VVFLFSFTLVNVAIGSLKINFFALQSPTAGVYDFLSSLFCSISLSSFLVYMFYLSEFLLTFVLLKLSDFF